MEKFKAKYIIYQRDGNSSAFKMESNISGVTMIDAMNQFANMQARNGCNIEFIFVEILK